MPSAIAGVKTAVTVTVDITDDQGAPKDPQTLTFHYLKPDGTRVDIPNGDPRIVRDGAAVNSGHYACVIDCDVPGIYTVRWASTGPEVADPDITFYIARSKLYP